MEEAGLTDADVGVWYGVLAPTGTPPTIIDRLNTEIAKAVNGLAPRFAELGASPLNSSPEEFTAFIHKEISRWGEIVKRSNAKVE
jgi:tripartite-type tricarboxylate transporter receptor subunit TctC